MSGLISQIVKKRNRTIQVFLALNFISVLFYLFRLNNSSANALYILCILLGTTAGYWAVIITMTAEQFGTNLRATVTTSVPNFIRFSLVPMNFAFLYLKENTSMINAALIIGTVVCFCAFVVSFKLKETFGKDLGFFEHI